MEKVLGEQMMTVTEFCSDPHPSLSAVIDLTFPWKLISPLLWFDIWTSSSGFAPHLSHS